MKWFFRFLVLILLVGGWAAALRSVHIIRSTNAATGQDRFGIIPKARWRFEQTYLDVRPWTAADLAAHEPLVRHLARVGKADLLTHVVPEGNRERVDEWLLLALENPPATAPAGE